MMDRVLFSFKDFRSNRERLRQKRSAQIIATHYIKDILIEEQQDKKSYWSWLPKDLVQWIAKCYFD